MRRIILMISLLLIFVLGGCGNFSETKISEEEAKAIVLKEHNGHIGEVEIVSVKLKGNKYLIEWENKDNCENGTDYVSNKDGKVTTKETTIC